MSDPLTDPLADPLTDPLTDPLLHGGNATVMVTDMDRAVAFYVEVLGLRLAHRTAGDWAMIDAGDGLTIGLHSAGHGGPQPGTMGSISVGFAVTGPIEEVIGTLKGRGVVFRGPVSDQGFVKLAFFADPDGNPLYLAETPTRTAERLTDTAPPP